MVPYKDLFIALHERGIRYLVAGGFAVNFHRVNRGTIDLDLILHLEESNVTTFIDLMETFGFKPRLPVPARDFARTELREMWIQEKNMQVFTFINPSNPLESVDVFVREPKPFTELDARKLRIEAFGTEIPVLGLEDLIALKQEAGRPKDLYDIESLKKWRDL